MLIKEAVRLGLVGWEQADVAALFSGEAVQSRN